MKCKSCGTEFDEGIYCPECGTKFEPEPEITEEEKKQLAEEENANREVVLAKAKADQERYAKERAEQEAELLKQKNEAMRLEQEREAKKAEVERKKQEVAEKEKVRLAEEEKANREVVLAKAKAAQEKYAKERVEQEAELLKQKNEAMRLEQEREAKKAEAESQKQEELSRTFNGTLYNTVEEMNIAKTTYEQEMAQSLAVKKANGKAVCSLVLSIAVWPLTLSTVGWFPALVASMILGIMALKENTEKRGLAIAGIAISIVFILFIVIALIVSFL